MTERDRNKIEGKLELIEELNKRICLDCNGITQIRELWEQINTMKIELKYLLKENTCETKLKQT